MEAETRTELVKFYSTLGARLRCFKLLTKDLLIQTKFATYICIFLFLEGIPINTTVVLWKRDKNEKDFHFSLFLYWGFIRVMSILGHFSFSVLLSINTKLETSLAVHCLRFFAAHAGSVGLIPGQGSKIPHATQPKKRKTTTTTT